MNLVFIYKKMARVVSFLLLMTSANVLAENPEGSAVEIQEKQGEFLDKEQALAQAEKTESKKNHLRVVSIDQTFSERLVGVIGLALLILLAYILSENKKKISWKLVIFGSGIQVILAFIVLKTHLGRLIFDGANNVTVKILGFSTDGARFIFGNLVGLNVPIGIPKSGYPAAMAPLEMTGQFANTGAFFAFSVMPTIIFFSAFTAVLYYFGILQKIVGLIARFMQATLRCSGAESFSAAANIFLGQSEAPLLVRPFLATMTRSEIMAVMTGGFATVSGAVLAAFVGMLVGDFPDIAGHLLAASVMSAPASLVFAKLLIPETKIPETLSASNIKVEIEEKNVLDAASKGTSDGLHLALNVGAMLIAFIALISMLNWVLSGVGLILNISDLSLDKIFAFVFSPFAYVLGVPWEDAPAVGSLLGLKTAVNEFVAYLQLADYLQLGLIKNSKSVIIATYALCGFANFASIGIQIGGLSALAPSRRHDFAALGFKAMIAGTLACLQTAAIAGIIL